MSPARQAFEPSLGASDWVFRMNWFRDGLAILHALLFDFLNYRSGALYPSWAAISDAANISERSVIRRLVYKYGI